METSCSSTTDTKVGLNKWCAVGVGLDISCNSFEEKNVITLQKVDRKCSALKATLKGMVDLELPNVRICFRHFELFSRAQTRKYCLNKIAHSRPFTTRLIRITASDYIDFSIRRNKDLYYPNGYLCKKCYNAYVLVRNVKPKDESAAVTAFNACVASDGIEVTPLCLAKRNKRARTVLVSKKLQELSTCLEAKFVEEGLLEKEKIISTSEKCKLQQDSADLYTLMDSLKCRLQSCTKAEKISLLTLIPDSWSTSNAMHFFEVSEYSILKAKEMKRQQGILLPPKKDVGHRLANAIVKPKKDVGHRLANAIVKPKKDVGHRLANAIVKPKKDGGHRLSNSIVIVKPKKDVGHRLPKDIVEPKKDVGHRLSNDIVEPMKVYNGDEYSYAMPAISNSVSVEHNDGEIDFCKIFRL